MRNGGRRLGTTLARLLAEAQVRQMRENTRLRIEAIALGALMAIVALSALLGWLR